MKTAVEWFVEEMFKQGYFNDKPMTVANINYFANIAKEMEVKQRQEDTNHGYSQGYVGECIYTNGYFETYRDHRNRIEITRWKHDEWAAL